jgi:hypothetical protein
MKHKVQRKTYLTVYAEVYLNKFSGAIFSQILEMFIFIS